MLATRSIACVMAVGIVAAATDARGQDQYTTLSDRAADLSRQAREHERSGDVRGAVARASEAMRLDPGFAQAYVLLAGLRERAGDVYEALRVLDFALEHVPTSADVYVARAGVHEHLGQLDEAIADLRAASALAPQDGRARDQLVELFVRQHAWSAALQQMRAQLVASAQQGDVARLQAARARTRALEVLAADTDPVHAGARRAPWERRALFSIGRRLGAL